MIAASSSDASGPCRRRLAPRACPVLAFPPSRALGFSGLKSQASAPRGGGESCSEGWSRSSAGRGVVGCPGKVLLMLFRLCGWPILGRWGGVVPRASEPAVRLFELVFSRRGSLRCPPFYYLSLFPGRSSRASSGNASKAMSPPSLAGREDGEGSCGLSRHGLGWCLHVFMALG